MTQRDNRSSQAALLDMESLNTAVREKPDENKCIWCEKSLSSVTQNWPIISWLVGEISLLLRTWNKTIRRIAVLF